MKEPRNKRKKPFLSFLRNCEQITSAEGFDEDQLFKPFTEDPEIFEAKWLRPLLAEGLTVDSAYELVLESILRPN